MSNDDSRPVENTPDNLDLTFGEEIKAVESGFAFRPISSFKLEIDDSVYMYSDDGNVEINLIGGELEKGTSIAELSYHLAVEFMDHFDGYELFDAGTDTIQGKTGLLNDIQFFNAEEEGLGRTLICTPYAHQFFFILTVASSDFWHRHGDEVFNALMAQIRFHAQFSGEGEEMVQVNHPDLTIETYPDIPPEDEFLLRIEKGDVSLLLAAHSRTAEDMVTLLNFTKPDGTPLYQYSPHTGELMSFISDQPVTSADGELCIFFPRNNQQSLAPGEYRFEFSTESGTALQDIQVIIRTGRALDAQAVNLNIYMAIENEQFYDPDHLMTFEANLLQSLNLRFSPLNLTVGENAFYHPAPDELAIFSSINIDTDTADCSYMIAETILNNRALNICLVDRLVQGDPPVTAGVQAVSCGHPGMILAPTSPHTCIIIGWSAIKGDISKLADIIIEQLIVFSGIETKDALPEGAPLTLNHEIAWRLRRHPIFYDVE